MSNQASTTSSAAPATAVRLARGLPRVSSAAVASAARAGQIPGELALVNRFIRDYRKHGKWAKAARAGGYYTVEDLEALMEEYLALIAKYGHRAHDAPPGARPMKLRMFYIPDEPRAQD